MGQAKQKRAAILHMEAAKLQLADKLDEALSLYTQALELDPQNAGILSNLGTLHQRCGRLDKSLHCFKLAHRLNPSPANKCNIGAALAGQDRHEEAASIYEEVLRIDPFNTTAQYYLGLVRFKQGRMTEGWAGYEYRHQT